MKHKKQNDRTDYLCVFIEPKTKGANNQDKTDAPDGKGGLIKVRRRAFYYKKNYTNTQIIPNLDLSVINK